MAEHVTSHPVAKWLLCAGVICIVMANNSATASEFVCPHSSDPDYNDAQLYPHATNCNQFYQCDNSGNVFIKTCPSTLYFNPAIHVCDWPSNVNCVNNQTSLQPVESDNSTQSPAEEFACPLPSDSDYNDAQLYPHATNCNQFYQCDNSGNVFIKTCPSTLYFNPTIHVCDWPQNVNCDKTNAAVTLYALFHFNILIGLCTTSFLFC